MGTRNSFLLQQPHSSLLGLPVRKDTAFRSSSPMSLDDAEFGLKEDSPVQKDDNAGEVPRVSKTSLRPLLLKSTDVSAWVPAPTPSESLSLYVCDRRNQNTNLTTFLQLLTQRAAFSADIEPGDEWVTGAQEPVKQIAHSFLGVRSRDNKGR